MSRQHLCCRHHQPLIKPSHTSAMASPYRGFIADGALDHVLMQLPIQVDDGLAYAAVDDRHTASVGVGDGCVRRR